MLCFWSKTSYYRKPEFHSVLREYSEVQISIARENVICTVVAVAHAIPMTVEVSRSVNGGPAKGGPAKGGPANGAGSLARRRLSLSLGPLLAPPPVPVRSSSAPVHDGFATVRAPRTCRPHSRSGIAQSRGGDPGAPGGPGAPGSPGPLGPGSVAAAAAAGALPALVSPGAGRALGPLWEDAVTCPGSSCIRTRPAVPWWELATRRARYRSCPTLQVIGDFICNV